MADNHPSSLDVKPEVVFAYELVQEVAKGQIRIPRFQRRFVWRHQQMRDLLDSIRRRYPIGSLLVWDTDSSYNSSEWVGPIRVPHHASAVATYVLDGQQRLSTLTGVLLHKEPFPDAYDGDKQQWFIYYDLKEKEFVHVEPKEVQAHHFPMWRLLHTFDFLHECRRLIDECGAEAEAYVNQAQELSEIFKSYKLPIVRILGTELQAAVDIFARLNSKGQRVTPDEIVSALAYREPAGDGAQPFDLAASIDTLIEVLVELAYGGIPRVMVLRVLLAALEVDFYRVDWTRIFRERDELRTRLPEAIKASEQSLRAAVGFLKQLGVRSARFLPYSLQLVALSEFFRNCPDPSLRQQELLARWFWVSSFSSWFGHGNSSRNTRLIDEFRQIAKDPDVTTLEHFRLDEPAQPLPTTFDLRSARLRAHVLVILSMKPQHLDGSSAEDDAWRLLEKSGPDAFCYIFQHAKRGNENDRELRSSPANRILNLDGKRGQAKQWLRAIDPSRQADVLESHGIPPSALAALQQEDSQRFLEERLARLKAIEEQFMKARRVTLPRDTESRPAPLDTDDEDT
jgi:hypothetical protein